jgi:hypothetical protein
MMYGVFALAMTSGWDRLIWRGYVIPLFLFMIWGAIRTFPYLPIYGTAALRDGAIWIWGTYALVVGSLIAAEPRRLDEIVKWFAGYGKWFLIIAPFIYYLSNYQDPKIPHAPWVDIQIIFVKGGDLVVHLAGILAYAVMLGGISFNLAVYVMMADAVFTFTGRAAMITFFEGYGIVALLRPRSPIIRAIPMVIGAGLLLMLVLDVHFKNNSDDGARDISAEQLMQNVTSVFTDKSSHSDLDGTKE